MFKRKPDRLFIPDFLLYEESIHLMTSLTVDDCVRFVEHLVRQDNTYNADISTQLSHTDVVIHGNQQIGWLVLKIVPIDSITTSIEARLGILPTMDILFGFGAGGVTMLALATLNIHALLLLIPAVPLFGFGLPYRSRITKNHLRQLLMKIPHR